MKDKDEIILIKTCITQNYLKMRAVLNGITVLKFGSMRLSVSEDDHFESGPELVYSERIYGRVVTADSPLLKVQVLIPSFPHVVSLGSLTHNDSAVKQ